MNHPYKDILYLSNPTSKKHPRMSMYDRAAQFSPFAALTGYDAQIQETARLTNTKIELSDDQRVNLDTTIHHIQTLLPNSPEVEIIYFKPDTHKSGGMYLTVVDTIKKIDTHQRIIITSNKDIIEFNDILSITEKN